MPVRLRRKLRAACVVLVSVRVMVTSALEKATSAEPVIASPKAASPRFTLVVAPHVPDCSPVAINSIFSAEYVDAILFPYVRTWVQVTVLLLLTFCQFGV